MAYQNARAAYLNEGEFDHSHVLISVQESRENIKKPFKYFTMWKSSRSQISWDYRGLLE